MSDKDPLIGDAPPKANVLLSSSVYDKLRPIAQIWLPALAVFYISVAPLWDLPKQEEVAGTIMALNLLVGVVMGVSHRQYSNSDARFDGTVVVVPNEDGNSDLNVSLDSLAIARKKEIVIRVDRV